MPKFGPGPAYVGARSPRPPSRAGKPRPYYCVISMLRASPKIMFSIRIKSSHNLRKGVASQAESTKPHLLCDGGPGAYAIAPGGVWGQRPHELLYPVMIIHKPSHIGTTDPLQSKRATHASPLHSIWRIMPAGAGLFSRSAKLRNCLLPTAHSLLVLPSARHPTGRAFRISGTGRSACWPPPGYRRSWDMAPAAAASRK